MDLRELIILGGGALIGLVVLHGIWIAWRRRGNPLRMKIEPDLVPEADVDDWLNGELPNGGARVAAGSDADEPSGEPSSNGPAPATTRRQGDFAQLGDAQAQEERQQLASEETSRPEEKMEVLVIHVLASGKDPFPGESLLGSMRTQGLKYGDMQIFHRIDPQSRQPVFSVANAVEPGYFNLNQDCSSPGLTAFLKLPGPRDAGAALEDMLATTAAIAKALGGVRLDDSRTPFTEGTADAYRTRIARFGQRQREP